MKAKVNKVDNDKLKTVRVDLSKLSDVVNNKIVKKTVFDKLAAKVHDIDTAGFALENKINDADKKIPNISEIVKKTDCDAKITEI